MIRGGGGHGSGRWPSERCGVGGALRGERGCDVVAALSDDFSAGQGALNERSGGDHVVRASLGRTVARTLQRVRAERPGGSSARQSQRCEGAETGSSGAASRAPERTAARRRGVDERQGGALDGRRAGAGDGRGAARLGGAQSDRVVGPEAATAQPEGGDRLGAGRLQKKSPTSSPRRPRPIRASRSKRSRPTNIGSG